jgi:uncharacterized membrane protein
MSHPELSLVYLLFLYLWPFSIFKDATRGNLFERAAAYRYNREKRVYLPGYSFRWFILSVAFVLLTDAFQSASQQAESPGFILGGFCALSGLLLSMSICVLVLSSATYLYLSKVEI